MSLMSVNEVADFLGVQESRVMRLEREHLLIAKEKSADDQPMFDHGDVAKYKELAERLGGIQIFSASNEYSVIKLDQAKAKKTTAFLAHYKR